MNIGIIIFVISVIVTIIGAINDNSHKDRQNQKPPVNKGPNSKGEQPKKGGFLDEIGKTFKEIEKHINEDPTSQRREPEQMPQPERSQSSPTETRAEKMESPSSERKTRKDNETEADKAKRAQQQQDDKLQKELEADLMGQIQDVRTEIDRENEKRLQRTEKKARAIIADKYLSERTKRFRLKQLMNAHAIQSPANNDQFRFADDEVVNGIIWSEVLERPKRL
ncbi:hypothetical protein NGH74_06175 [Staphylococcus pseudoxylosus]|uniref:hypothetical protein n=1 Tax=Staphylococcus pseudoxylosus TaxID=2282419 RepID=UPI000D1D37AE|nr:hypothetical protein [Staphylococcus pseudoxylosus]PTI45299.1 hypothetical protein BU120_05485 [Staphylococcus xylosus]MEB6045244.1 hypothetical protein [Staphylococcus pseudoxylosus]MEB6059800.1 hypothetical protein [Staphylococcus pseudoxylosus]MEB7752491.1 hypothetical protein [Staphylococcus pseudoxylosus]MEB8008122.1 hypothetical protein [Staphylococcus pseudoxylosus]